MICEADSNQTNGNEPNFCLYSQDMLALLSSPDGGLGTRNEIRIDAIQVAFSPLTEGFTNAAIVLNETGGPPWKMLNDTFDNVVAEGQLESKADQLRQRGYLLVGVGGG